VLAGSGHADVDERDVRRRPCRELDGLAGAARGTNKLEPRLAREEIADRVAQGLLVLGDQDGGCRLCSVHRRGAPRP